MSTLKLSLRERFQRNLHPHNAWYVTAYCKLARHIKLPISVMSARIEYDTTSFVMFLRSDGTPF